MKLKIQTSVAKNYQQVWEGFTEDLFNQLSPPFPPVKVIQFDGCHKGDIVELELNFLLFNEVCGSGLFQAPAQGHRTEDGSNACSAYRNRSDGKHLFEDVHSVYCFCLVERMRQRSRQLIPRTVAYNDRKVTYCDRNFLENQASGSWTDTGFCFR